MQGAGQVVLNLIELATPRSKVVVEELDQEQFLGIVMNVAFQVKSVNGELRNAIPLTDLANPFERKPRGQLWVNVPAAHILSSLRAANSLSIYERP
jgi:hypothetical protein